MNNSGAVLPAIRKERYWLAAVFFALGAVFASWAGRVPQIQEHLALTDGQLGTSMFCLALGSLISMPVSAALAARFGSALMTLLFSVGFCLTLLLLPLASSWWLFSASLFTFGFALGGQDVSMNAHAVQVERAYRRPIMSSFHGTFSVGAMSGGAFSSLMCTMHVLPLPHFAIVATILIPAMLAAGSTLTSLPAVANPAATPVFVLPDRHIMVLAAVAFCSFIGEGAISDWSAVYMDHELHSGPSLAAAGYSIFSFSMAVCRFAGDGVVQRLGPVQVLLFSGIIAAGGIATSLFFPIPKVVLAAYLLAGVGFSCMVPVAFSAAGANRHLPASIAIAGVATAGYFGFVIAPPIIGFLADRFTLRTALWLPVALSLIVSALAPLAARETEQS